MNAAEDRAVFWAPQTLNLFVHSKHWANYFCENILKPFGVLCCLDTGLDWTASLSLSLHSYPLPAVHCAELSITCSWEALWPSSSLTTVQTQLVVLSLKAFLHHLQIWLYHIKHPSISLFFQCRISYWS